MKAHLCKIIAPLALLAAVAFFQPSARCADFHSGAVQVLPSQFPKEQTTSQVPVSNSVGREGLGSPATRGSNDTNAPNAAARDQSRSATRSRTADASGANDRRDGGVCTHGNPQLIGVHCSTSSECNWGARCVGIPARCANTGAPCVSRAECLVPGICSSNTERISRRDGQKSARSVPYTRTSQASPSSAVEGNRNGRSSIPAVIAIPPELPARRN
jgi:hypothetical protein